MRAREGVGESNTEFDPLMRPLEDVRVLALEQYAAGPFATAQLADLGADVIKIEDPTAGGDVGRYVPPRQEGTSSLFFETFNRGKRSISLNLRTTAGRSIFEELVKRSDVVFANVRGDIPERLGLRYADLRHLNSAIVCCFLTAYGLTSSEGEQGGYDYIMQGRAGWMSLTGEPHSLPQKTGISLVDYSAGLAAAVAVLSAIHQARRTGEGDDCDVALFDTSIGLLTYIATWYLSAGVLPAPTRHSAHPSLVPFQNFQTSDGWIVVACAKEKFWAQLVKVLGEPEFEDSRYANFALRREHAGELLPALERRFRECTTAQWLERLQAVGIPCGRVNDVASALADPLVAERRMIVETEHEALGKVRQVAGPVRVGQHQPITRRGPTLGEHNEEVLREVLCFDRMQVDEALRSGAFGMSSAAECRGEEGQQ